MVQFVDIEREFEIVYVFFGKKIKINQFFYKFIMDCLFGIIFKIYFYFKGIIFYFFSGSFIFYFNFILCMKFGFV